MLMVNSEGAGLAIRDTNNKPRLGLGVEKDGNPSLEFLDEKGSQIKKLP